MAGSENLLMNFEKKSAGLLFIKRKICIKKNPFIKY